MTGDRRRQHGQILPLFAFCLVAILAMTALLFDGSNALVQRRKLQNAGDAAALAASNIIQAAGTIRTCSATGGPPPGAPRADIVAAALASVNANLPGFTSSDVIVTCPDGWQNQAVRVDLRTTKAGWFGGSIGAGSMNVATTSVAVNGRISTSIYSVVQLDPSNLTWPQGRRGCPSFLISGGPQITFDGSVQLNSTCSAGNGGALATNGGSAQLTLNAANNAQIRMVGGYAPAALTITPAPVTGQKSVKDPLLGLEPIPLASLTVRSASRLVLSNTTVTLQPGIYTGGIQLKNSSKAYLRPGIYVLDGGGLDLGAQAQFCSVTPTATPVDCVTNWAANCPDTNCGVLLYNKGTASGAGAMDQISVGAGTVLKLRAYDDRANANQYSEYRNLIIWQDANPIPTSTYPQPVLSLNGGGSVDVSGTVYAPSAKVQMGGSSGGAGGSAVDLTLQFLSWDLELSGNSTFHFIYNSADFARPTDYGLVQ